MTAEHCTTNHPPCEWEHWRLRMLLVLLACWQHYQCGLIREGVPTLTTQPHHTTCTPLAEWLSHVAQGRTHSVPNAQTPSTCGCIAQRLGLLITTVLNTHKSYTNSIGTVVHLCHCYTPSKWGLSNVPLRVVPCWQHCHWALITPCAQPHMY